jgi:hypothetical protein
MIAMIYDSGYLIGTMPVNWSRLMRVVAAGYVVVVSWVS